MDKLSLLQEINDWACDYLQYGGKTSLEDRALKLLRKINEEL